LRRSKDFGGAAYSVDARKQARIIATAPLPCGQEGSGLRFDVVSWIASSRRASMDTRRILRLRLCGLRSTGARAARRVRKKVTVE